MDAKQCQMTRLGLSNAPNSAQRAVLTSLPRHLGTTIAPDSKQKPSSAMGPLQRFWCTCSWGIVEGGSHAITKTLGWKETPTAVMRP